MHSCYENINEDLRYMMFLGVQLLSQILIISEILIIRRSYSYLQNLNPIENFPLCDMMFNLIIARL